MVNKVPILIEKTLELRGQKLWLIKLPKSNLANNKSFVNIIVINQLSALLKTKLHKLMSDIEVDGGLGFFGKIKLLITLYANSFWICCHLILFLVSSIKSTYSPPIFVVVSSYMKTRFAFRLWNNSLSLYDICFVMLYFLPFTNKVCLCSSVWRFPLTCQNLVQ